MRKRYRLAAVLAVAVLLLTAVAAPLRAAAATTSLLADYTHGSTQVTVSIGGTRDLSDQVKKNEYIDDHMLWQLTGNVNWTSSNETVATVSGQVVTGHRAGVATLTGLCWDNAGGLHQYVVMVRVSAGATVAADSDTSFEVTEGKELDLGALFYPDGMPEGVSVAWSSTSEDVGKVDDQGKVLLDAIGRCVIKVTETDAQGASTIRRVQLRAGSMQLQDRQRDITIALEQGATVDLLKVYYPNYVGTRTERDVRVSTGSAGVVSVDGTSITAVGRGSCTVSVILDKGGSGTLDNDVQWITVRVV